MPFLLLNFSRCDKIEDCSAQFLAVCWIIHVELIVAQLAARARPLVWACRSDLLETEFGPMDVLQWGRARVSAEMPELEFQA